MHTDTQIYTCMHTHAHTRAHTTHTHTRTHTHTHAHTHTHTQYTHTHVHTHTHTHTRTCTPNMESWHDLLHSSIASQGSSLAPRPTPFFNLWFALTIMHRSRSVNTNVRVKNGIGPGTRLPGKWKEGRSTCCSSGMGDHGSQQ